MNELLFSLFVLITVIVLLTAITAPTTFDPNDHPGGKYDRDHQ